MKPLIVDIETTGEAPQRGEMLCVAWQEVGGPVSVAWHDDTIWYGPAETLHDAMADPDRPIVTMTKYDARYLRLIGWDVAGPYYDLQVMAWILNENQPLSLDALAKRYCGITMDKRLRRVNKVLYFKSDAGALVPMAALANNADHTWAGPESLEQLRAQLMAYCARDVQAETQLYTTLRSRLEESAWWDYFVEEEMPFTETLLDMEVAGLPVDIDASENLRARLEVEAAEAYSALLSQASLPPCFNLNSGDQLATYVYEKTGELSASLDLGLWAVECLKSCLGGEHDDCGMLPESAPPMHDSLYEGMHIVDLLPEGFVLDKLGRTHAYGYYTFKGRGITPTERTESGSRWSTKSPVLKSNAQAMRDEWVVAFLAYRKVDKVLTTYLRRFPVLAQSPGQGGSVSRTEVVGAPAAGEHARGENAPVLSRTLLAQGPGSAGVAGAERRVQAASSSPEARGVAGAIPAPALPRLYGKFNQTGTKTGRLSSSEPNLQNIPSHGPLGEAVRGLFTGDLIVGDYSQLEPRLMGHFSQDPVLLDVYTSGQDIYEVTARSIFGTCTDEQRGIAKTLVLAMGYGAGAAKVAQILTVNGYPSEEHEAKAYLRELRALYTIFFQWREAVVEDVTRRGYVTTLGGRHRRLKAAFADRRNWKNIGYGSRQAVNAIVQGSAGDIVRKAMMYWPAYMTSELSGHLTLLAQVHDELVWEHTLERFEHLPVHNGLRIAAETAHGYDLTVPLVFEPHFGPSWFAAKEGIELPEDMNEESHDYQED